MSEYIRVEHGGAPGVAVIRLDRPPMNALSAQMRDELLAAAAEVARDDTIRAVVVFGGDKTFAAGADVKELAVASHADMVRDAEQVSAGLGALAGIPKPVIAAVTGYALGGGCEVALAADFRISADDAKWGLPEITLGLIPGGGGTQRLARLVGPAKAKDLIFTGRMLDADEALSIGLVDVVIPAEHLYDAALAMAAKFAQGPALALRAAKQAIDVGLERPLAEGLRHESELFASLFATDDAATGLSSFTTRGPGRAVFNGPVSHNDE